MNLFDINKLRYECINNHQHNISTCYTTTILQTDTPACLGQWCSQETQATSKEDLEDFVQWRRRQPGNAKAMVSAECEARMSRSSIHHLRARVQVEPVLNGGVKCMQMYGKFEDFPLILVQCLGW